MKIIRRQSGSNLELWRFVEANLPASLRVKKYDDGYGTVVSIEVRKNTFKDRISIFSGGIAIVKENLVELRHPEYYSDFEGILQKYEALTGKETTLEYWES